MPTIRRDPTQIITIDRHFLDEEKNARHATGQLTKLLNDIVLAVKTISHEIRQAGLSDILGSADAKNVHGEVQQELDVYANQVMKEVLYRSGALAMMGSEEEEKPIPIPAKYKKGKYIVFFDPLDGSSNIDVNASVGTTFSIYLRRSSKGPVTSNDMLRPGREQIAAGYALYGSSTMFVYSTGHGTHGFTYTPDLGEFLLSHPDIKIPKKGKYYSINEAKTNLADEGTQLYINKVKNQPSKKRLSLRYIGTLVADAHRTLLKGGIFIYPGLYDGKEYKPKLRLLYEGSPIAMIIEQAGGLAYSGNQPVLDVKPTKLHQKLPYVIGSANDVRQYLKYYNKYSPR
ncbi:MAG: class 1 fructose-bisphosphatase [Patescibacteria group bacterium]